MPPEPIPPQSQVASYLPAVIRAGLGANQSLLYLRGEWENLSAESRGKLGAAGLGRVDVGMTPRRQTFLRLYALTSATLSRREQVATAPINRLPEAHEISQWPAARPGGFLYQTLVAVQRAAGEVYFTQSAYFTRDLVTYEQAASQAVEVFLNAQTEGRSFQDERILGPGFVTAVSEFVPQ